MLKKRAHKLLSRELVRSGRRVSVNDICARVRSYLTPGQPVGAMTGLVTTDRLVRLEVIAGARKQEQQALDTHSLPCQMTLNSMLDSR